MPGGGACTGAGGGARGRGGAYSQSVYVEFLSGSSSDYRDDQMVFLKGLGIYGEFDGLYGLAGRYNI